MDTKAVYLFLIFGKYICVIKIIIFCVNSLSTRQIITKKNQLYLLVEWSYFGIDNSVAICPITFRKSQILYKY